MDAYVDSTEYPVQLLQRVRAIKTCKVAGNFTILKLFIKWVEHFMVSRNWSALNALVQDLSNLTGLQCFFIVDYYHHKRYQSDSPAHGCLLAYGDESDRLDRMHEQKSLTCTEHPSVPKLRNFLCQSNQWITYEPHNNSAPEIWDYLETTDYSGVPVLANTASPVCDCSGRDSLCRAQCQCATVLYSRFKLQGSVVKYRSRWQLICRNLTQRYLIECSDQCKCDKQVCSLTIFPLQIKRKLYLKWTEGSWSVFTYDSLLPGELVLEYAGVLQDDPLGGVWVADGLYLNTLKTNISKYLRSSEYWNLDWVPVLSYVEHRVICRIVLFATSRIHADTELVMKPFPS